MATLSVIIPTFNEIDSIEDALKSVKFAHEIIVIDNLSFDNSEEISKKFGARFISIKNFSQ